jgi:hypothetical protein
MPIRPIFHRRLTVDQITRLGLRGAGISARI